MVGLVVAFTTIEILLDVAMAGVTHVILLAIVQVTTSPLVSVEVMY